MERQINYLVGRSHEDKANWIQILSMCQAFGTLLPTTLFVGNEIKKVKNPSFSIITCPHSLKPISVFSGIQFLFSHLKGYNYTREPFLAATLIFFGKKVIFEEHKYSHKRAIFFKICSRRIPKIIVVTEHMKKSYIDVGINSDRLFVAHDAVPERFLNKTRSKEEARKILRIETSKKIVVYTGGLAEWKGVETVIDAACNLDDFLFYVIGGRKGELEAKSRNILHVPKVSRSMARLYQLSADILVLPNSSKSNHSVKYTSPLKLFEYMSCKRVIVASNLPSIREILSEGINAYLFEPDNKTSLASEIIKASNADNSHLINNAFDLVKKHTWEKRAARIINFIKK